MACVIKTCKSSASLKKNLENLSFHKFPDDKAVFKKWIDAVVREDNWVPKNHHRICSKHFTSDCFTSDDKWRRLIEGSIPTLDLQSRPVFIDIHAIDRDDREQPLGNVSVQSATPAKLRKLMDVGKPTEKTLPIQRHPILEIDQSTYDTINMQDQRPSENTEKCAAVLPRVSSIVTTECSACAVRDGQIHKLKKEIERLKDVAHRRLLKINCIRNRTKRLEKKL